MVMTAVKGFFKRLKHKEEKVRHEVWVDLTGACSKFTCVKKKSKWVDLTGDLGSAFTKISKRNKF